MLYKNLENYGFKNLKNTANNLKIDDIRRMIVVSAFAILISGCGGSEGGNNNTESDVSVENPDDIIDVSNNSDVMTIRLKSGTIMNSNVELKVLGGNQILGTYMTNQNGEIEIDKEYWNEILTTYQLSESTYIEINTTDGDDVDSDNDGDLTNTSIEVVDGSFGGDYKGFGYIWNEYKSTYYLCSG